MKKHIFFLLSFISFKVFATNYYIKNDGNDGAAGTSPANAWASISKLNASFKLIVPGDSILFKCGDVFYGKIIAGKSGSASAQIVFSCYGTGVKPIISGFTNLNNWINSGGGIFKKNIAIADASLIIVTINNNLQRMGRFPNADAANGGWLYNEAVNNNALTLTDKDLSSGTNWTGAEAVMRKQRWIIDRCKVVAQNGNTITYTNPTGTIGGPSAAKKGWGYFFQNDIRTLDQFGEWYFNSDTKDISIYFGTNNPASYKIKASITDTLLNLGGGKGREAKSFITIEKLSFEGANKVAIYGLGGSNILIKNCKFNNNYNAVDLFYTANSTTSNNTITNCLNNGLVQVAMNYASTTIQKNTIKNIGLFAGMGGSGDANYAALRQNGNNGNIQYNRIDSVGYNGIEYNGSNTTVAFNYITNFCITKDDGGGIYTQGGTKETNRTVTYNIVIGGIGAPFGSENKINNTIGIYTDDNSNNVNINHNTIANIADAGLFCNGTNFVTLDNNIIYNAAIAIKLTRSQTNQLLRNNTITANQCFPNRTNIMYWNGRLKEPEDLDIQTDMHAIGKFDNNFYRSDIQAPFKWYYHKHAVDGPGNFVEPPPAYFSLWQNFIHDDANSHVFKPGSAPLFKFNPGTQPLRINFAGQSKMLTDGTVIKNSYTIPAFSGVLLL